jgi:hypothetical protein
MTTQVCSRDALPVSQVRDVHITCPSDLVEQLVSEFEQQFTDRSGVEVYDYGWSSKFRAGYIVLSWEGRVDPVFEAQLDADDRLEGHTVYDLPQKSYTVMKEKEIGQPKEYPS